MPFGSHCDASTKKSGAGAVELGVPFFLGAVLLLLALSLIYQPTFSWLVGIWWNDKEYSHGFLVPLVSAFLIWKKRGLLRRVPVRPSWRWGLLLVGFSVFLLAAGRVSGFQVAEGVSFLLITFGLVLCVMGWRWARSVGFALLYLQFMIPWSDELLFAVQGVFQQLSADLATGFLRLFGYPVFQDGTYIYLPGISLEVARECSGVNFSVSVLALGLPLVYLTQRSWIRGVLVLAGGLGIAFLCNGLRVALCGVMGESYGPALLHGPFHVFQGWSVAQVGVIGLFLLNWAVARVRFRGDFTVLSEREASGWINRLPEDQKGFPTRALFLLSILLVGAWGYLHWYAIPRPIALEKQVLSVSGESGDWHRVPEGLPFAADELFPGATQRFAGTYRNSSGREVFLSANYFALQSSEKKLVSFRSAALRDGARVVPSGLISGELKFVVSCRPVLQGREYEAVFWYQLPSGPETNRYVVKFRSISDALLRGENNGAVVLVATPRDLSAAGPELALADFLRVFAPQIQSGLAGVALRESHR